MPSGFVEHEDGMTSRLDVLCDFVQMQLHRLDVAPGQDQADGLALFRANRAKDIGRGRAQVARRRRTRSPPCPTPCDLVLLSDARLVGEPDFYAVNADALLAAISSRRAGKHFENPRSRS